MTLNVLIMISNVKNNEVKVRITELYIEIMG